MQPHNRARYYERNRRKRGERFLSQKTVLDTRKQLVAVEEEIHTLKALGFGRELGLAEGRAINSLGKKKRRLEKKLRRQNPEGSI